MAEMGGTSSDEVRIERKIKNGKLLECRATFSQGRLRKVRFTGDFFLHPEEAVEELEVRLEGKGRADAKAAIMESLTRPGVEMAGISPADFADMMDEAFSLAKP